MAIVPYQPPKQRASVSDIIDKLRDMRAKVRAGTERKKMFTIIHHYEDEMNDVRRHAQLQGWEVVDPNPPPPGEE